MEKVYFILMQRFFLKRVYEPAVKEDGARFLVERLWPRGVSKDSAKLNCWLKEVAPSAALRKWYGHDPKRWGEFRLRYLEELSRAPENQAPIREAARKGNVTLVFAAKNPEISSAGVLKEFLEHA